jgi:4-hydroxybutyryl-CoA dehydratase/vinylacetyl-CoA-Delta-isomerase
VHVVERNAKGIVISGTKAIVTGAPYMHEFLVMPSRNMGRDDADFAVCCAVPIDAKGLTVVARPAGRPGEKLEHLADRIDVQSHISGVSCVDETGLRM